MANDGTVKIGTNLDDSGFKSGVRGLGSFATKGFGVVGGAAKAMAGVTIGALATIATGMGATIVAGVKYNAAMEMYTANFKTMLGSEEAAIAKVNELKKLGASTPFEMADLATATTTLLAFGVTGDKTTDSLKMLGDISLGNVDKLQRLTNAFGKAQSQGKLTGETVQMMIEAGFNPLKVISETTGESMSELQKRMSKGAISAEELSAAFKTATSEGGQFYKGMETASTTFDGLISTLKDNANSLVGEVVKPLSDSMSKTLLPSAIGMIQELTDAFQTDGIPGLINAAGSVVGKIITGIAEQAPKVIEMASGFLTTLLNALMDQLPTLSMAGTGIITGLLNAMITQIPQLLLFGMSLIVNILDGLAAAMPTLIPAAQAAILLIAGILAENLNYMLDAGIKILIALLEGMVAILPELVTTVVDMVIMMGQTIIDNLPMIITAAIQILLALIAGLTQALPVLIDMLPKIIMTIVNTLLANLPAIINAAINLLLALIDGLVQALPLLSDMTPKIIIAIVNALLANLPLLLKAAVQIIGAVIAGLIQSIPTLAGTIPKLILSIKDAFMKFDWGKLGKDIIAGVKDGFIKAAGGLLTAAKDAIGNAINGVKKFLGIHSPSKLMRDIIGKNMVMGVSVGIKKNSDALENTAVETTRGAVKAMQGVSSADMVGQMQRQALGRGQTIAGDKVVSINRSKDNEIDYDKQARANAKALKGMKVDMDGRVVGEIVAPYVDEELGDKSNMKLRYAV